MENQNSLRVCIDVGCHQHQIGISLPNGKILEEFVIAHHSDGFADFFSRVERHAKAHDLPIAVAMESYNGHARPLDQQILERGWDLWSINNHKFAQFKKIFPGPAKTDKLDTRRMLDLFKLQGHLPLSKTTMVKVMRIPEVNIKLKRLTRRRSALVQEKVAIVCRFQSDLRACAPGLLSITRKADNLWFLRFITSREDLRKLARLQKSSLKKVRGVGEKYCGLIKAWQEQATFSEEVEWVNPMIYQDAKRILSLLEDIEHLEKSIEKLSRESEIAIRLQSIVGFGHVSAAELAGEIGAIERFKSEASLALYLGMAVLDNSSGVYEGSKKSNHVNRQGKKAMMIAVARHINHCVESKKYYDKKRAEGKKHNQAVRAMGRHMTRVIYSMLTKDRDYVAKDAEDDVK